LAGGVLRATIQVTFKAGFAYAMSAAVTLFGSFDGEPNGAAVATPMR